jgi:hypothetical protein
MAVMIGVDPHKGSHTAVALDESEEPLGDLRVRSATNQVERLLTPDPPIDVGGGWVTIRGKGVLTWENSG